MKGGEKRHHTKFQTLTFKTIPQSLHSFEVEEGFPLDGRSHTQMLAHREERPRVVSSRLVSSSGSGLFCVLRPSLVDSIVNGVKWKEVECGGGTRNYVLWEVACLEVWQGMKIFQPILGIMSKSQSSHSTRNGSHVGDEWLKMKGRRGLMEVE